MLYVKAVVQVRDGNGAVAMSKGSGKGSKREVQEKQLLNKPSDSPFLHVRPGWISWASVSIAGK